MVKKIGLLLVFLGVASGVWQLMTGEPTPGMTGEPTPRVRVLVALSWINYWGEATGWGIRGLLVFVGGGMLFLETLMGDEGLEG